MGMDKLLESKQKLKRINATESEKPSTYEPIFHRNARPCFEERFKRVTTYLENDLYREVEALREQGRIINLKTLYNEALRDYLRKIHSSDSSSQLSE